MRFEAPVKVKVLFFGLTHDLTGLSQEEADLREGETLDDLWRRYAKRFPRLGEMAGSLFVAVNEEIADRSRLLRDGDEVAFMPPVSGGAGPVPQGGTRAGGDFFRLTRQQIPTGPLTRELKAPQDGAVVVFDGIVRDHSHGRKTLYLEYEAYEPMAVRKMEAIGRETKQKFAISAIGMIHRLGRLEIGESSVVIIVAAGHRRAAFEACHYAIDRLKQTVPIWKKEYFEDGGVWAEGGGQTQILIESSGH